MLSDSPHCIVNALCETKMASVNAIGHLHSLHYHWEKLNKHERAVSLASAKHELERALVAVVLAEQEIASAAKSEPSNVIQIGDHSPEPVNRHHGSAPSFGGDAA